MATANHYREFAPRISGGGPYGTMPGSAKIREFQDHIVKSHRPETLPGFTFALPGPGVEFHALFNIDLISSKRDDSWLDCCICRQSNHFGKGAVFWCTDGYLRAVGWFCVEKHFGAARSEELLQQMLRDEAARAADDWLIDNLEAVPQIFNTIHEMRHLASELERIQQGVMSRLSAEEKLKLNYLFTRDHGILKGDRRYEIGFGRFKSEFEIIGQVPPGRFFDQKFKPLNEIKGHLQKIEIELGQGLLSLSGEGFANEEFKSRYLEHLSSLGADKKISLHRMLAPATTELRLLRMEVEKALQFPTTSTLKALKKHQNEVPFLQNINIHVKENGFIFASRSFSASQVRWPIISGMQEL